MLSPAEVARIRRGILDIAQRRQRPGSGSSIEFLRRRTAVRTWPDLTTVFRDILWATVGAVATRHDMPERATGDLEVVVAAADAPEARRRLAEAGDRCTGELTVGGSTWLSPEGLSVDVLESGAPWVATALAGAPLNRDLQGLPVLPLPCLIVMKPQARRVQDLSDVTRMLGQADEHTPVRVRQAVARYEPEAAADVEQMIALGRLELEEDSPNQPAEEHHS